MHSPGHPDTPERLVALEGALAERDWLGWERAGGAGGDDGAARARAHRRRTCARSASCAPPAAARSTPTRSSARPPTWRRCTPPGRLRDGPGAARRRGRGRLLRGAPVRPPRRARAGRWASACSTTSRSRRPWRSPSSGVRARADRRLGRAPRQRHRRDLPPPRRRARREHPPAGALSRAPGPLRDAGTGEGEGYTINLPVPAGSGEELWLALLEHVVLPAARGLRAGAGPRLGRLRRAHRGPAGRLRPAHGLLRADGDATCATWPPPLGAPLGACSRAATTAACSPSACARRFPRSPARAKRVIAPDPLVTSRVAAHVGHYWEL